MMLGPGVRRYWGHLVVLVIVMLVALLVMALLALAHRLECGLSSSLRFLIGSHCISEGSVCPVDVRQFRQSVARGSYPVA